MEKLKIPTILLQKIDSWTILEGMLDYTNEVLPPPSIVICSFSIAEGWIKRLWKLKKANRIDKITVVLDEAVMVRHRPKITMLENVVDNIYLNNTHAKMILVESSTFKAAAVLSANATMNYRIESCYITNRSDEIDILKKDLQKVYDNSKAIRTGH